MKLRLTAIVLGASLLAGCATTDANRGSGANAAAAYDGGYYVAAHDGFGDYYYDRPQVATGYDPWSFGAGFGGYGWYGAGFAPWGFGYPFWYGGPWYWHHHHGWHHAETGAVANATVHSDAQPAPAPAPAPVSFPARHDREIRAPRHGSQHSRP